MDISNETQRALKLGEGFLLLDERDQIYLLSILQTLLYAQKKYDSAVWAEFSSGNYSDDDEQQDTK